MSPATTASSRCRSARGCRVGARVCCEAPRDEAAYGNVDRCPRSPHTGHRHDADRTLIVVESRSYSKARSAHRCQLVKALAELAKLKRQVDTGRIRRASLEQARQEGLAT